MTLHVARLALLGVLVRAYQGQRTSERNRYLADEHSA